MFICSQFPLREPGMNAHLTVRYRALTVLLEPGLGDQRWLLNLSVHMVETGKLRTAWQADVRI